jgi:hypothetical protein
MGLEDFPLKGQDLQVKGVYFIFLINMLFRFSQKKNLNLQKVSKKVKFN